MNVAVDFTDLARQHHRELHVHCYRMLGSYEAAEDHVQEVFLRAWRARDAFEARSSARTWLYRIATNACLDTLRRSSPPLQPYPDHLLDERPASDAGPDAVAVDRETMSLAFLAAIRLLPPRQRAVLILRDVLAFSAREAADLLGTSVTATNSALQRARTTLREHRPGGRSDWSPGETDPDQRDLLNRYIAAHERADPAALVALLREDVTLTIEPGVGAWTGRPAVAGALRDGMTAMGRWRMLPTAANGRPAVAGYVRATGEAVFRPFVLSVLSPAPGGLVAMHAFRAPGLFAAFGLPPSLDTPSLD
jgi:RNA polymerase sigma-70 factor (ECF subfamily)